jgi:Z1 domain-containing protein
MILTDDLLPLYVSALDAMKSVGPSKLLKRVRNEASLLDKDELGDEALLVEALSGPVGDSPLASRLRTQLTLWDAEGAAGWTGDTPPKSDARRERIYALLEVSADLAALLTDQFPVVRAGGAVVISNVFEPWYADSLTERPPFYWDHYERYLLEEKLWDPEAVANLGLSTTRVVERLADPERVEAYQAKGLVVGYVQSGKTANFTGVIAKAIDAGYRLVIVLTGSTDLLRNQTQRRVDKELVGQENLLKGIDVDDLDSIDSIDYYGEKDWDAFIRHGDLPSAAGHPDIRRLTTKAGDYRSLRQGIEALDFPRVDPTKPLNAAVNLRRVDARVVIVKKNASVLTKLAKDLKKITAKLEDIPALIIDDESDQASVNTVNPKKWVDGQKQRTAINREISTLLRNLPRGQYIGYTATPFANVFADPSDAYDIFPRDFLLSLDRPPDYMGPSDFHDLEPLDDDERTFARSKEKAFVRPISDDGEDLDDDLGEAIDAFVLSGAIKLFRETHSESRFVHHTMLVHESVQQVDHRALANRIKEAWDDGGWFTHAAKQRLERLYDRDFAPVIDARAQPDELAPPSFAALHPYIGEAATKIAGSDGRPVWIINGDKEVAELDLDFDARPVWKILVGGAKLSRGFTVEGLTISYYRRSTTQADTLMQMGRWFGFRPGYRDLVRLYIGGAGSASTANTYNIYKAFEAACRSEELFREEIRKYSVFVDGKPQLTPADLHPLVTQHVPWLKPAAKNKMYNTQLVERRSPGARLEPTGYSDDPAVRSSNAATIRPLVDAATSSTRFLQPRGGAFDAYSGTVSHETLIAALAALRWAPEDHFRADLTWLEGLTTEQITDWAVVIPQLAKRDGDRTVFGRALSVHVRRRRDGRSLFGALSDPKHRLAGDRIAGNQDPTPDATAAALHGQRRGAVLLYPVYEAPSDEDKELPGAVAEDDLIMALALISPRSTGSPDQPLIRFRAIDPKCPPDAMVDPTDPAAAH